MNELCLAAMGIGLFFAFRWRARGDRAVAAEPSASRFAGRALRTLLVPALIGMAFVDWRPTLARYAPSDWLARRAADEASPLRDVAAVELVRRLNAGWFDDANLAPIVRGLWRTRAFPDAVLVPGEPYAFNLSLIPPELPLQTTERLDAGRQFGTVRWRVIEAHVGCEPGVQLAAATPECVAVSANGRSASQALTWPAAATGRTELRCTVAFTYHAPGGRVVGVPWTETFASDVLVAASQ